MKAKTYTEFQPLEEVIVGKAYDPSSVVNFKDQETREMLGQILHETEEDLQKLIKVIEGEGATVRRPEILFDLEIERYEDNSIRPSVDLHQFGWIYPTQPLMPRDTAAVYGETIVEFFTKTSSRYFENWSYQDIFMEYYKEGNKWISMPMPILEGKPGNQNNKQYEEIDKILFHAANVLKCGNDLFHTGIRPEHPQGKGTMWGLEWLKRTFGDEYNINPIHGGGHADGKMAILKPGVVKCWNPDRLPDKMKNWEIVVVPDSAGRLPEEFENIRKRRFHKEFIKPYLKDWIGYCDETVFDVNSFSVREDLVITNGYHKETCDKLNSLGIEVWPWHFRHQWFWDGAIHCVTLDTKRKGEKEDYFK